MADQASGEIASFAAELQALEAQLTGPFYLSTRSLP